MRFQIGLLLFPNLTQLDLTGPYEVFTKFPDTDVHLLDWDGRREERLAAGGCGASPPPLDSLGPASRSAGFPVDRSMPATNRWRVRLPPGFPLVRPDVNMQPAAQLAGHLSRQEPEARCHCRTE